MDLRHYYRKIREIEEGIAGSSAIIVTRATSDGGRKGSMAEVPRGVAAKLIANGKADLASEDDVAEYRRRVSGEWHGAAGVPDESESASVERPRRRRKVS